MAATGYVGLSQQGFLGGIVGAGWTNSSSTDTGAFQSLSLRGDLLGQLQGGRPEPEPYRPKRTGPFISRLRDEIEGWHGDILELSYA